MSGSRTAGTLESLRLELAHGVIVLPPRAEPVARRAPYTKFRTDPSSDGHMAPVVHRIIGMGAPPTVPEMTWGWPLTQLERSPSTALSDLVGTVCECPRRRD